jgi:hypothetical protein
MKALFTTLILLTTIPPSLMAQEDFVVTELVDTPTPTILPKGKYELNLRIYNEGDIILRFGLSLSDRVMLGVPLDIYRFIGKEEMEIELPPVVWGKIALIKKEEGEWPLAIGYDPVVYKENGRRGLFLVSTKSTYIQNLPLSWHIGLGADLDPEDERGVYGFCGMDLGINPNLALYTEMDWIDLDGEYKPDLNLGMRYITPPHLEIDMNLRRLEEERPDRFIRVEFSAKLF